MAMSVKSCAVLLALGACMTTAQDIQFGRCDPHIQPMTGFDAAKYLGRWYENSKYFAFFELGGKCVTADYSFNEDRTVKVVNNQINSLTNQNSSINGKATFENNDNTVPKLTVQFPSAPVPAPYWVLETDYENYAVVYSCTDAVFAKGQIVWILTRERTPSQDVIDKAYAVMDRFDLDKSKLQKTDQTGCQ